MPIGLPSQYNSALPGSSAPGQSALPQPGASSGMPRDAGATTGPGGQTLGDMLSMLVSMINIILPSVLAQPSSPADGPGNPATPFALPPTVNPPAVPPPAFAQGTPVASPIVSPFQPTPGLPGFQAAATTPGVQPVASGPADAVAGTGPDAYPVEVLNEVNAFRAHNGLPPVRLNDQLNLAAARHSDFQASTATMSHTGQNGSQVGDRVSAAGYPWQTVAENVAFNQATPEEVVQRQLNAYNARDLEAFLATYGPDVLELLTFHASAETSGRNS